MDSGFKKKNIAVIVMEVFIIILGIGGITFATSSLLGLRTNTVIMTGTYGIDYIERTNISDTLEPISDDTININKKDNVMRVEFSFRGVKENDSDELIYDIMLKNISLDNSLLNKYTKWNLYKNGSLLSTGNFDPDFDGEVYGEYYHLTTIQEDLKKYDEEYDNYVFILWISESCDDLLTCEYVDQSNVIGSSLNMDIFVAIYAGEKLEYVRHDSYDKSGANKPNLFDTMVPIRYVDGNIVRASVDNSTANPWYNYSNLEYANAVILKSDTYKVGDIIKPDDILEELVWIPRFEYKLWNVEDGEPESYNAFSEGIEVNFLNGVSKSKETNVMAAPLNSSFINHPGFRDNRGFWITKNEMDETNSEELIETYKANAGHIINNLEWGAVMYLTNSKYGNMFYTSSTGNPYGINDISTDSWEKVSVNNGIGSATNEIIFSDGTSWDNVDAIIDESGKVFYLRNVFAFKPFVEGEEYKTRYKFY